VIPPLVRRLLLATFVVSTYNTLAYFFVQIRSAEPDYSDLSFWASFPQIGLSILIYYSWHINQYYPNFKRFIVLVIALWLSTISLNALSWYLFFIDEGQFLAFAPSIALGLGLPVYNSGAPLSGLFHWPWLDAEENVTWEFDGGIGLSWLILNVLSVILIIALFKIAKNQGINDNTQSIVTQDEEVSMGNCGCATPSITKGGVCGRCGGVVNSEKKVQMEVQAEKLQEVIAVSECHRCQSSMKQGQLFCSNCGEPANLGESTPTENEELECDQCGADLVQGQKFCGGCGIEMVWPHTTMQAVTELSTEENQTKKYLAIAAAVLGVILLFGLFSSGGTNQQEECFDREMLKFGAYADPKGWAIKSRLYCQSLYP
jgi:hypothetical protein